MSKKLLLFFMLPCIFCATSFGFEDKASNKRERTEIDLRRCNDKGGLRSSFVPFEVFLNEYTIDVTYLQDLPCVDVEILNECGECIYRTTVNPVLKGRQLIINISNWSDGYYTIYLRDRNGSITYGEFEL